MSLAGSGFLLSLGPEILLDPLLEFHHVGHDMCVLHAFLKVGVKGRSEEYVSFAIIVISKDSLGVFKRPGLSWGQGGCYTVSGRR